MQGWVHSAKREALPTAWSFCMGTCMLLCAEPSINVQCMCESEFKVDWLQEECMHEDSLSDAMTTLLLNTISPSALIALTSFVVAASDKPIAVEVPHRVEMNSQVKKMIGVTAWMAVESEWRS